MGKGHSDELYTPDYAVEVISKYLSKDSMLFECAVGTGKIVKSLEKRGFRVLSSNDFFNETRNGFDIIISNPPYSKKDDFIKKCYEIGKPFALLLPINAFEGLKRQALYKQYGIQVLLPNKRIDFNGKGSPWFYTAWFCWKLLPKDIMFCDIKKKG